LRTRRWIVSLFEAGVVLAGLLMVLRYQYQVASLAGYDLTLDLLFVGCVAGVLIVRRLNRPGGRGAVLRLAFVLIITTLSLVGAEYAARFAFRNVTSSGNATDFIAGHGGGPVYTSNSLGFREREIPAKQPGRYRIAVIGDSLTWGQGVEASDRFSNLVEGFLGSKYEVFNFGLPGNNMPEHADVLERALPVSPDFVLLQIYINDFEPAGMKRPQPYPLLPGPTDRDMRRRFLIYDLLSKQWAVLQEAVGIVESYPAYMARNLLNLNAPNAVESSAMLHRIVDKARAAGVPIGIVVFPAYDAMGPHGAHYPFGFLHERIKMVCADEKLPCLDLLPVFSKVADPRTLWVTPFDAHPSAATHRRAALEIVTAFGPAWHQ
jgi:lysophospholipase L1-like esterase